MRIRIEVVREGEEASAEARAIVPLLLERIQAAAGDGIACEECAGVIEVFLEPVDVDALVSPRDCYLKAEPGEPRFTLLGRDSDAAIAIRYWTMLRAEREGFCEKVRSAGELADRFDEWRRDHDRGGLLEGADGR